MYADIIIDISHEQLDKTFQYAVPDDMDGSVDIGTSVRVPFGKGNRIITGYVIGLTDKPSYPVDKIKSIDSVVTGKVNVAKSMIKLAAWLKRHYGCTMNQALKTVIPVKDEVGHKQKKSVCLLVDTKKAQELISIYEKKAKAKYRLMCALIDEPVIDMEIVKDKLNISPATVKALEADGIINVKVESYYRNPVSDKHIFNKKVVLNEEQQRAVDKIGRAHV